VMINGVEREPRAAWKGGAKPAKLDEHSWLAEVVEVIDGTGVPATERAWWCEVMLPRPTESWALECARVAAAAWYDETDQSGDKCVVVLRVTAWTGEAWTVEVPLAWELKASPREAEKVGGAAC
jgi:ribosomal protein S28E/S33